MNVIRTLNMVCLVALAVVFSLSESCWGCYFYFVKKSYIIVFYVLPFWSICDDTWTMRSQYPPMNFALMKYWLTVVTFLILWHGSGFKKYTACMFAGQSFIDFTFVMSPLVFGCSFFLLNFDVDLCHCEVIIITYYLSLRYAHCLRCMEMSLKWLS